jgi:hypothetical protein
MTTKDQPAMPTARRDEPESRSGPLLDQVAQGYVLVEDAIVQCADAGAAHSIAELIALRLGIEADRVAAALDSDSDEPVTVLCRAAVLNVNVFSAVLRMRRRRRASDLSPPAALSAFCQLSVETAQRAVRGPPRAVPRRGR